MLDWVYNVHPAMVVGAIVLGFVAICWFGIFALRPVVKHLVQRQPGLNETVGDFLQYFGVIYGLLLGLLAVATYQNLSAMRRRRSAPCTAMSAPTPSRPARKSRP